MTCFRLSSGESVRKWCFKHNASYRAYCNCVEKGMEEKESLEYAKKAKNNYSHPTHFYKGKSVIGLCKGDSPRYFRVLLKMRNGMPIELALKSEGVI